MLERVQRAAAVLAVVCGLLGVAAGAGCSPIPQGPQAAALWLHPVLLLLGAASGCATILRKREIGRRRGEIVQDSALTKGEREHAHREAEAQIRVAGTVFVFAPLALGFWLTHQFQDSARLDPADLLIVSPLLGYGVGLLWGARRRAPEP